MASLGQPPPQKPPSEAPERSQPHLPPPPAASVQYYPYSSPQAPPYPHAPYYGHGQNHPPGAPGFLPSQTQNYGTMYTRPPVTRPDGSTEDLPSYEEMIVNALTDHPDPEGAPPKDLFAWMAARYPLQTNFRPSASQALQKAFKRGRLEKGPSGKYRLNASWEGGSVGVLLLLPISSSLGADASWVDFTPNDKTPANTTSCRLPSPSAPSVYTGPAPTSRTIQLPTSRISS